MPETKPYYWRDIFLAWACAGVALVVQAWAVIPAGETPGFIVWVLSQQVFRAFFWAMLTPLVWRLRARLPMSGAGRYWHVLAHLLLSFAGMTAFYLIRVPIHVVVNHVPLERNWPELLVGQFNTRNLIDVVCYWSLLLAGWLIAVQQERRSLVVHEAQLEARLAEAELRALKQQVQPHFLFNSLNALSSLMRDGEKDKAVETLAQLSGLLRLLMGNSGRQEVELHQELDYIQRYLAVEKVRFEDRLEIGLEIDEACLPALVPTLILQPVVENAIKHGIARRRSPGRVRIVALRRADQLHLEVWNDPAEQASGRAGPEGHGLGLSATRARLERAYGAKFLLEQNFNGLRGSQVVLEIPFKLPAATRSHDT